MAAFANPYSLYSVDELIENLEAGEKMQEAFKEAKVPEPSYDGYNIFKDNFRKIKNLEEYSQMEEQMKEALKLAQQDVYEEKPLFFSPEYEKSSQFKVKEEEMTAEKVRKLMAFQIEMEKVSREFNRTDPQEHQKYEALIRKKVEKESKRVENDGADFDDDWDGYESDWVSTGNMCVEISMYDVGGHPWSLLRVIDVYWLLVAALHFLFHSDVGIDTVIEIFFSLLQDFFLAHRNDPSQEYHDDLDCNTQEKEKCCDRLSFVSSHSSPDTFDNEEQHSNDGDKHLHPHINLPLVVQHANHPKS